MIVVAPVAANAMLDTLRTKIDSGTTAGLLRLYSGTAPATADASLSTTNILLAELTLAKPSAPAAQDGKLTFGTITEDAQANASGTATFFRIGIDATTALLQGSVSVGSGTGDLKLDKVEITAGSPVRVNSAVFNF